MLLIALAATSALALPGPHTSRELCDRPAPAPASFHSRGFTYVAEIFPPGARHNTSARPRAYFYELDHPGTEWKVEARRIWTGALINSRFPRAAIVSMGGDLVTLDDYDASGPEHAIVIYDRRGQLVRSYLWSDFLTPQQIAATPRSDCGLHWIDGARFYFTADPDRKLYAVLRDRAVLEFDLRSGMLRRNPPNVSRLRALLANASANEQADVWQTSLRFSSITDMLSRN